MGQLDQSPPLPSTPEEKKRAELRALSDEEKRIQAYEWKLQGHPTAAIAQTFGVDSTTIRRWFKRTESDFREQFETKIHKRMIEIKNPTKEVMNILRDISLPAGIDITVKDLSQ